MKYSEGYDYVTRARDSHQCKFVIPGRDIELKTQSGHLLATLRADGLLTWEEYYAWDGASYSPDLRSVKRGSLIHDIIFQMIRLGLLERDKFYHLANKEIQYCIIQDKGFQITAWAYYRGVETSFAYKATLPRSEPPILVAP